MLDIVPMVKTIGNTMGEPTVSAKEVPIPTAFQAAAFSVASLCRDMRNIVPRKLIISSSYYKSVLFVAFQVTQ